MRRLPLYICIDCGINMHSLFPKVKDVVAELLKAARNDPFTLESMWMSFVSIGRKVDVVKLLCPLSEIHGISVQPIEIRAEAGGFEAEMVKIFSKDLILQRTATQRPDFYPRILWLSDGSRPDFVKRCLDRHHWKKFGPFAYFCYVNVSSEDIKSGSSIKSLLIDDSSEMVEFWGSHRV